MSLRKARLPSVGWDLMPAGHFLPPSPARQLPRTVHLIGVAGSGMQSLGAYLLEAGCEVSGSDASGQAPGGLLARGLRFQPLPSGVERVVYSAAVPAGDAERVAAVQAGIATCSYAEMLGQLTAAQNAWAVAGTHGKSSVCGLLVAGLQASGRDPSHIFGAVPRRRSSASTLNGGMAGGMADGEHASGGHAGSDATLVVEACEYAGNFLHLQPQAAILLGVEGDHFDCYPTQADLHAAYEQFVNRVSSGGVLAVWADDAAAWSIAQLAAGGQRVVGFGLPQPGCEWHARVLGQERGRYSFEVFHRERRWGRVSLAAPGEHQVVNALAAAVLAAEQGVPAADFAAGLAGFRGLRRRLEFRGQVSGVAVVDDYAHHPTELAAAIRAVRAMFPRRRLVVVFQPHQASRTARLLDEFAHCLQNADRAYICDIYRAREGLPSPTEKTASDLAAAARELGGEVSCLAVSELQNLALSLASGDVLLTAGAGDIGKWTDELVRRFGIDSENE